MDSTITMNDGNKIPVIGLGLWQAESGQTTQQAISWALEAGYRHFDTAAAYGNEKDVGIAIANSNIPREEIFVTTKIWNTDQGYESTLKAADTSLKNLQIGYIDLLLLHSPLPGPQKRAESYKALQELVKKGLVKSIGVSNYGVKHLQELLDSNPEIKPAVNQVEIHPWLTRSDIVSFCNEHNIVVEAYSPLTRGQKLNDPILTRIANEYGKTSAQILIRWGLQHNFVTLPKSVKKERIIENANIFDFEIKKSDMETLDSLDEYLVVSWDPTVAE
ncbi:13375_t:CDS:2 [Dentiscutata heterogama]|uniref:13375_t:CDS:1 n=1 Tax=Dentiscutata heterogama TaxID=1316150 RepID=A0ACA9MYK7_9GLOM|nr:13375_t:CDS:2 [Dentiscutata heterogama]